MTEPTDKEYQEAEVGFFNRERTSDLDAECRQCAPLACDDPDRHFNDVPSRYTPLRNRGCYCGADFDGRDCMCFESYGD